MDYLTELWPAIRRGHTVIRRSERKNHIKDGHAGLAPDLGAYEYPSTPFDMLFDDGFEAR
jgi:hypothetical protein